MTYVNHQQTHQANQVSILVQTYVDALAARNANIVSKITAPDGRTVDSKTTTVSLKAGENVYLSSLNVSSPQLW